MSKRTRKVWEYQGDLMSSIPGVPADDLTATEYEYYCEIHGEAAMRGIWRHVNDRKESPEARAVREAARAEEAADAEEAEAGGDDE
jgi:hypothetical protein